MSNIEQTKIGFKNTLREGDTIPFCTDPNASTAVNCKVSDISVANNGTLTFKVKDLVLHPPHAIDGSSTRVKEGIIMVTGVVQSVREITPLTDNWADIKGNDCFEESIIIVDSKLNLDDRVKREFDFDQMGFCEHDGKPACIDKWIVLGDIATLTVVKLDSQFPVNARQEP